MPVSREEFLRIMGGPSRYRTPETFERMTREAATASMELHRLQEAMTGLREATREMSHRTRQRTLTNLAHMLQEQVRKDHE